MAPPKKPVERDFMAMMENFMETHMPKAPCECPQCRKSSKRTKKVASRNFKDKDIDKENLPLKSNPLSMSTEIERQYCSDHRPSPVIKSPAPMPPLPKPKDKFKKPSSSGTIQKSRGEKVNDLLKADSVADVFEVFKLTETSTGEHDLAQSIQDVTSQCKLYAESRAKIIEYCKAADLDPDAVFGLLAKFRQERSLLTSAIIKSNSEREKYMSAICEAEDFMRILKDLPKDGDPEKLQYKIETIHAKIHALSSDPCQLYEELLDLRDEHMDLLADHEEQHQKFLEIESCHEKLHEDKKKLQDDLTAEKREHLETRRKLSALQSTKNEVNQAHKSLEKVQEENSDLKKEIEKLTTELGKINALKHENTQLKKKLATAEAAKLEPVIEPKTEQKLLDTAQPTKKKKGKKGTALPEVSPVPTPPPEADLRSDPEVQKEIEALKQANADIQSQLAYAQTNLRQLEVLLKKAELAKSKALEQQQIEKATAQNWEQLSESHLEESTRLKEQLEQSITEATTLQNRVHSLEQSLAEVKEQLQRQKRSVSPSATSQTSAVSKFDTESLKMLRKLRGETAQLVMDLDTARNYPGDPWNLVDCTRNLVAGIDRDLDSIISTDKDSNTLPDTYMPYPRSELSFQTPIGLSRIREATPPLTGTQRPPSVPSYRPLLPPGLAEPSKSSPKPAHFPSPIGTGRPVRNGSGMTPSPTQHPVAPSKSVSAGFGGATSGASLGNGGVDWSIWSKR